MNASLDFKHHVLFNLTEKNCRIGKNLSFEALVTLQLAIVTINTSQTGVKCENVFKCVAEFLKAFRYGARRSI